MWPTRGIHARSCRPLSPSSSPACRLICIDVATAADGAACILDVPADDPFHRVVFFGSCPSAKNGRGDKDMAQTDVGQTGQ